MSDQKALPDPSMDEILASIRRILAEDDHVTVRPRIRVASDILDLTEALNDDGSVRHIAPVALVTPEAPPPLPPDGRVEPLAPRPDAASAEPQLVSPAASEAVAASFARLAETRRGEDIEESVRDALRPMLQAWLDAHLPDLVERLVRAEIARVVGGSRPAAP
jgi:cell pole-organizing protein PopZ